MPTVLVVQNSEFSKKNTVFKTESIDNQTLFDCLEDAGYSLPFGCLAGSCGACRVEVIEGKEFLKNPGEVETDTINMIAKNHPNIAKENIRLSCRAKIAKSGNISICPIK